MKSHGSLNMWASLQKYRLTGRQQLHLKKQKALGVWRDDPK